MTRHDDASVIEAIFACARDHPFYRDHLAGIADCRDAPVSDKAVLKPHLDSFSPHGEPSGVYLVRSGGSTGSPLIFPVDLAENHAQRSALARALLAAGIFGPQTVALNLFGYADLYRSAAIVDDLLERCGATTLPMSAHAQYADMVAVARRFTPSHVLGTPSKLQLLADFVRNRGEPLDIPDLLYAGETLAPSALAHFAAQFGTRTIASLYGGAETGIWAWSHPGLGQGRFAILPGVAVEVIAPDSEGFGELAVTNGYRRRFPVFRYLLGDVGRVMVQADGTRILELRGRNARSFIVAEEHFDLAPFADLARDADGFQVQLSRRAQGGDTIELLLVDPGEKCALDAIAADLAQLLHTVARHLEIAVRRVPRTAFHHDPVTGKTPAIADLRR